MDDWRSRIVLGEPEYNVGDIVIARDRVVNGVRLFDEAFEVIHLDGIGLVLKVRAAGSLGRCRRAARRLVKQTGGRILERRSSAPIR